MSNTNSSVKPFFDILFYNINMKKSGQLPHSYIVETLITQNSTRLKNAKHNITDSLTPCPTCHDVNLEKLVDMNTGSIDAERCPNCTYHAEYELDLCWPDTPISYN